MIVLGIESSCDETSASVVRDGIILSNSVFTQQIHKKYGGVVPEIASREHESRIIAVILDALKKADLQLNGIDSFAACYGPGLMGALLVGVNVVKGLAIALKKPYIGVNHLEGHLYAGFIENKKLPFPFLTLLISGGHTQLWEVTSPENYKLLGKTVDDAAGEAFDKGARMLGLGYPGGPEIQRVSKNGDPTSYSFPRPEVKNSPLNFSFSGLKTALFYTLKKMTKSQIKSNLNDLASSYQEAIIDALLQRIKIALYLTSIKDIVICGGVAANFRFRNNIKILKEVNYHFPPIEYCTDNGAMIALTGYFKLMSGKKSPLNLTPIPNLNLENTP